MDVVRSRSAPLIDDQAASDMVLVSAATFRFGSDRYYSEEQPARTVQVDAFLIDRYPVTNHKFASFVGETGHVTLAQRTPDARDYPHILPEMRHPGSLVFVQPTGVVDREDWTQWWQFVFGADWMHPEGPQSSLDGREDHPVVHIACADAEAYADWAGKRLPTEAQWECAARGGLLTEEFAWGNEFTPQGVHMANTWQGQFPHEDLKTDGFSRTSPVGVFPANGFGLYDMIGNVWEWTADWYEPRHTLRSEKPCCAPRNPRGGSEAASRDPCDPQATVPRRVLKGGSHLCAPNYCQRYRPAARHPEPVDTSTTHIGFRCALPAEPLTD